MSPRNLLDFDAAIRAIDPSHGVGEIDRNAPERDESEKTRLGGLVVFRGRLGTPRAPSFAVGSRANAGDEGLLFPLLSEFYALINESLERMDGIE